MRNLETLRLEIIFNLIENVSQKFCYPDRSIKRDISWIFRKGGSQKRGVDLEMVEQTLLTNYASKSMPVWLKFTLMARGGSKIIKFEAHM